MAIAVRGTPTAGGSAALATSLVCNVPSGVQAGDILVWLITGSTPTNPATDPAGWTRAQFATTTGVNAALWYRVSGGSEPATYTSPTLTSAQQAYAMVAYSGVDNVTPLDVAMPAASAGTTAMAFPAITPVTTGAWVLGIGSPQHASSTTVPTSETSTNLTIDANGKNTATTNVAHVQSVIGHAAWTSGAFTPAMTSPTATARTLGQTMALRPASAAAATAFRRAGKRRF
jgi:hypothetical protein